MLDCAYQDTEPFRISILHINCFLITFYKINLKLYVGSLIGENKDALLEYKV